MKGVRDEIPRQGEKRTNSEREGPINTRLTCTLVVELRKVLWLLPNELK